MTPIWTTRRILRHFGFDIVRHMGEVKEEQLTTAKIVTGDVNGEKVYFLVVNDSDRIQREHLAGRFYEPDELAIISRHFAPGGIFLDVGANVGNHSLYAMKFLGASHVIAVEPNPVAYRILCATAGLNCVLDRFAHHAVGLSDDQGRASIHQVVNNLGATSLSPDERGAVKLVTGDNLLSGRRVDFIKIDTEGMEMSVLRGLTATIRRHRPALFVEVFNNNASEFTSFIEQHDYRVVETFRRYVVNENFLAVPRSA